MAHHKRKGPKSSRAGCLFCKPFKRQGARRVQRVKFGDLRRLQKHAADEGRALRP